LPFRRLLKALESPIDITVAEKAYDS
jgi:hypothetical protein